MDFKVFYFPPPAGQAKTLFIMKLTAIMLLSVCLTASAEGFSQRLSLSAKNVRLEKVFKRIESQTGYQFLYTDEMLKQCNAVKIELKNVTLQKALDELLKDQPLSYTIIEKTIVIKPRELLEPRAGEELVVGLTHELKGRITGENGQPLSGVSIKIKGSTKGTTTDEQGYFAFTDVDENTVLEVSFVGYTSRTVAVSRRSYIDINLQIEVNDLQAVVVSVPYGTQKRKEVVGAISQVNLEESKDMPVGTFAQKIQGKLAGVQINQSNGRPGQGMSFRIRGAASINAGNAPLIVVDGAPITGSVNNINPDEIESITALKDASATALYGARAANGVILITTRQAKPGETRVDFNAYYGFAKVPESALPDMMNAREFATYMKWRYEDRASYEGYTGGIPTEYQNPEQYGEGTNWFKVMMRNAPIENYTITVSGGNEKSRTSITGGYFHQEGILYNTGYRLASLRINNETKVNDVIKLGFNIAPSLMFEHNTRTSAQTDGYRETILGGMLSSPLAPAVNPDGSLPLNATSPNLFNSVNWYRKLLETKDDWKTSRLLGNAFAEINLLKGLTYKLQTSTDMGMATRNYFLPSTAVGSFNVTPPGNASAIFQSSNYYSWLVENTLNYSLKYKEHAIEALAGYSAQSFRDETGTASGNTFPDNTIPFVTPAAIRDGSSAASEWTLLSMIGRVNYNFKDKYFLSGAVRRDGSSRFGADRKYGIFPSVGVGWIVSEESFMQNIPVLSFLKIRGSYGLTGNNNIGTYPSIASVVSTINTGYVFNNSVTSGAVINSLGNPLLNWERTKKLNIGADVGLWSNRITLSYEYYYHLTDGMLFNIDIPQSSGYSNVWSNIGTFSFWGHELDLNMRNLTGAVKWNGNFNISFNKSLVKQLGTTNAPVGTNTYSSEHLITVGRPVGQLWGFIFDGVYMTQDEFERQPKEATSRVGSARMKDISGPNGVPDGKIDINDRTMIGDPNPDFIFGFSNDFTYKRFDLNIAFAGVVGGKILDHTLESTLLLDGLFNMDRRLLNLWRSEANPGNGQVPRSLPSSTNLYRSNHTGWLYDATNLTCKNIALGYTLPVKNVKFIKQIRIYGSAQQAFVLSKYRNPEASSNGLNGVSQGVDFGSYPVPRTFSFGVNMKL